MGYEMHELRVEGVTVGYVPFQNTADVWSEDIYTSHGAFVAGRRLGQMHCTNPPYSANRHAPHPLIMAELVDPWNEDRPMPWLYCSKCRCAISPPHDGYVYADEYPAEWLRFVKPAADVVAMYEGDER